MSFSKIDAARISAAVAEYADDRAKHSSTVKAYLPVIRKLKPTRLFSSNTKTAKEVSLYGRPVLANLMTLAPHSISGHNVCPNAGDCADVCNMHYSGMRIQAGPRARAIWNTLLFFADRSAFERMFHADVERLQRRAAKLDAWCGLRPDGASDLGWLKYVRQHPDRDTLWYGYTKRHLFFERYLRRDLPANYWLAFSADERSEPERLAVYLRAGGNVIQVCDIEYVPGGRKPRIGAYPQSLEYAGERFECFNADKHDVRVPMLDGRGRVGVLAMKGVANATKRRGVESGFARGLKTADFKPRYA